MKVVKRDADAKDEGYIVPPDFLQDTKDPLVDITMNDSTELWLIHWPKDQRPDYNGQEVSIKLRHDGKLGSFVGSAGKDYDVISGPAGEPNATVFVSSALGTKIAGKISRRVSFVHYPEPSELEERLNSKRKQMYQESPAGMLLSQSSKMFSTPTRSSMPGNNPRSAGSRPASTHSSRPKSSLYSAGEPSQGGKKRHAPEPSRSMNRSSQSSGRAHSGVSSLGRGHSAGTSSGQGHSAGTSSGQGHSAVTSSGQSHRSKSRKKSKDENLASQSEGS